MNIFGVILIAILDLVVGLLLGYFIFRYQNEKRQANVKTRADDILKAATDKAQKVELDARDSALKIVKSAEDEITRRRSEQNKEEDRLNKRRTELDARFEKIDQREQALNKRQSAVDKRANEMDKLYDQEMEKLQQIAEMGKEEARQILLGEVEKEARGDMARIIRQIELEAKEEGEKPARMLIADAIQRVASEHVAEVTSSVVPLPNNEMKGRIIVAGGRFVETMRQDPVVLQVLHRRDQARCHRPGGIGQDRLVDLHIVSRRDLVVVGLESRAVGVVVVAADAAVGLEPARLEHDGAARVPHRDVQPAAAGRIRCGQFVAASVLDRDLRHEPPALDPRRNDRERRRLVAQELLGEQRRGVELLRQRRHAKFVAVPVQDAWHEEIAAAEIVQAEALPRLAEDVGDRHRIRDGLHVTVLAALLRRVAAVAPFEVGHLLGQFARDLAVGPQRVREERVAGRAQIGRLDVRPRIGTNRLADRMTDATPGFTSNGPYATRAPGAAGAATTNPALKLSRVPNFSGVA